MAVAAPALRVPAREVARIRALHLTACVLPVR